MKNYNLRRIAIRKEHQRREDKAIYKLAFSTVGCSRISYEDKPRLPEVIHTYSDKSEKMWLVPEVIWKDLFLLKN